MFAFAALRGYLVDSVDAFISCGMPGDTVAYAVEHYKTALSYGRLHFRRLSDEEFPLQFTSLCSA